MLTKFTQLFKVTKSIWKLFLNWLKYLDIICILHILSLNSASLTSIGFSIQKACFVNTLDQFGYLWNIMSLCLCRWCNISVRQHYKVVFILFCFKLTPFWNVLKGTVQYKSCIILVVFVMSLYQCFKFLCIYKQLICFILSELLFRNYKF